MAKKTSKAETALIWLLIFVGLPIYLLAKFFQAVGWIFPLIVTVGAIALILGYKHHKKRKRLEYLRNKYLDEDIVQKIVAGLVWQGQSEDQLQDTLGDPVSIDRAVLKTKRKEVWKYRQQGVNRFGLRVIVENGHVVGWNKKA